MVFFSSFCAKYSNFEIKQKLTHALSSTIHFVNIKISFVAERLLTENATKRHRRCTSSCAPSVYGRRSDRNDVGRRTILFENFRVQEEKWSCPCRCFLRFHDAARRRSIQRRQFRHRASQRFVLLLQQCDVQIVRLNLFLQVQPEISSIAGVRCGHFLTIRYQLKNVCR